MPVLRPIRRCRVVIAGAGIGGLEALIALRRQAPAHVDVTLVAPAEVFAYRPMAVEEAFGAARGRRFSLTAIAADLGAVFVRDRLLAVDGDERAVRLASGRELRYDALILALGARQYPAFTQGITFDREDEREAFDALLADVDAGIASRVAVVVPEQVLWTLPAYELALQLARLGRGDGGRGIATTLVTHEPAALAGFGATVSRAVARVLRDAGVDVLPGRRAVVISDEAMIAGARWLTCERIVALPRMVGPRPHGVPADDHGFVPVGAHGEILGVADAYAVGDGAAHPVKQGGLAAQQADAAASHLLWRAGLDGRADPPEPVLRGVLRTPDGPLYLEAALGDSRAGEGSSASWRPLWPAPGRVVSRWVSSYLDDRVATRAASR
jgi:sulfide:quinone oxidoreductase